MIYPRAPGPAADSRALELDVQVALRVDGFRWVRWREGESPDPPCESGGRFLARRDDPLGHLQVPAPASMPLAAQPYRHLPRYSLDATLALEACDRVGLFQEGATLRHEPDGAWALELPGAGAQADRSLPRLLARAALVSQGDCRQELQ